MKKTMMIILFNLLFVSATFAGDYCTAALEKDLQKGCPWGCPCGYDDPDCCIRCENDRSNNYACDICGKG